MHKLQRVQNCAARLLTGTKRTEHISPVLKALHWLPIRYRTMYKILIFVFNSLILLYNPRRALRPNSCARHSTDEKQMNFGDRAFSKAGPCLWNNLPPNIQNIEDLELFERVLKTHFFDKAFAKAPLSKDVGKGAV
ncbi:uncharacterized protein LOC124257126 [Haliotis rubra]|uniref:uncharacterized protein LOC124257126 n=1 Tax=Haliotis rubra TaxID=36100 RepID=UPI001EE52737|nr:uncharacterized protein LOC124257126 [Haliotis rubra]